MKLTIHCCATAFLLTAGVLAAKAQTAYSMHTLAKGETLSLLSKNYHTTVGDIMRLNGMNAQSQLHAGDKIKIPAGGTVVPDRTATAQAASPAAPVNAPAKTHVVAVGETLFHISQEYKIPLDKLKALNNLPDVNVKVGQTLLVSEGAAPLGSSSVKEKADPNAIIVSNRDAVRKKIPAVTPAPAQGENTAASTPVTKQDAPPPAKSVTEPSPQKSVTPTTANVTQPTSTTVTSNNDNNSNAASAAYPANNAPAQGYFINMYGKDAGGKQPQTKNGASMTFKSASGWADKKYYILMNDAPTGSIVKVSNGKTELYAKVLWNLGEMKENDGLSFRISTATAAALGITDQKFDLKVSYYE